MIKLRHIILEQSTNPKAMILAGSPGAGKSSFIEGVKDALVLNVDDYFMRNLKDAEISLDLKNIASKKKNCFRGIPFLPCVRVAGMARVLRIFTVELREPRASTPLSPPCE